MLIALGSLPVYDYGMNERGTYGSNGAGSFSVPGWRPYLTVGAEADPDGTKRLLVGAATGFVMSLLGAWAGARATPENPAAGSTIGAATGLFFHLMIDQTSTLKRIANRMP